MKAVILAAGRGTRMGALTEERPKCLTLLNGKPLLEYQLNSLRTAGISDIGVVRGYKKELINYSDLTFFDNEKWAETNMVASMMCADVWFKKDDCLMCYGDILYPSATIRALLNSEHDIIVPYNTRWLNLWSKRFIDPLTDAETFQQKDGKLTDIGRKTTDINEIQGQYMGMVRIKPSGWQKIIAILHDPSVNYQSMFITDLLQMLLARNVGIYTLPVDNEWMEVDNENDLEIAHQMNLFEF